MVLIELMFGLAIAAFVLLLLPFLLLMAGIAGAILLWLVAPAALLAVVVFWLLFPSIHGSALLLALLIIGLILIERRSRYHAYRRP